MGDRKRKHCWNNAVKQKCVEPGINGLMFTSGGIEKLALKEAYNLIDELVEADPSLVKSDKATTCTNDSEVGPPPNDSDDDEEDVADALKKACTESRETNTKKRRCKQRPTGVKNCIFVHIAGADVNRLAEKMVELAQASPRCRFLQRVFPIEETADFDVTKLSEMITACVTRHLRAKEDGSFPSYALEFKARNNDSLRRDLVLDILGTAVSAVAPTAKVNLSDADVVIFVQLVRKTLMIGGMPKFHARRKYSMRSAANAEE